MAGATLDLNIIDTTGPTKPTGLQISASAIDTITLSASGSTDSGCGFNRYQYKTDDTVWSSSTKITGLEANKQYTIYTRAVDNLSNVSGSYSTTFTINTYAVTYDKNTTDTVSNMPSNQTKIKGINLNLSSNIPKRTGYTFKGWSKTASGTKAYEAGGSYTDDNAITLYAIWEAIKYNVRYNSNGGTGTMENSIHEYDSSKKLTANKFEKEDYRFGGWSTTANGTKEYADMASVKNLTTKADEIIDLYAIWHISKITTLIPNAFYEVYFETSTSTKIITFSDFGSYSYPSVDYLEITLPAGYTLNFSGILKGNGCYVLDYLFNDEKSTALPLSSYSSENLYNTEQITKAYTVTQSGTYYITGIKDYTGSSDRISNFELTVTDPDGNICELNLKVKE